MSILAAVPVKDLGDAKQRLVPLLTQPERRQLARAMLEDVLTALGAALAGSVWVVTSDPEAMDLARGHGVRCLVEPEGRGHTEAVALAQQAACERRVARFLTVPGDVPCVSAEEVRQVLEAAPEGPGALFVPSLSGAGTNAALLCPPGVMPLRFGEPSFEAHLEAARHRGLAPRMLRLPGLGLDIDAPKDLGLLLERGTRTRSAALLARWGIGGRLLPR